MLGILVRALADRAAEVARWETGCAEEVIGPGLASAARERYAIGENGTTAEFRIRVRGPQPTTYVVTVSEVRTP